MIFAKANLHLEVPVFDILLPVGISFYIFQALSYTMDVYREEICAEKNFFRYALFVSFFPQLVAGPIERSKNLLKQFAKPKNFEYSLVRSGLLTMLWGYFLKTVIADRCAVLVNTVYADYPSYYGFQLMTANILFAFQIYCDFMAYSTIAKGAARVLGFDLMDNFRMPYFAVSIKDFWRRWHISLSSWLRDYLYIPLGGNRKGRLKKFFNLILTFLVSGLWHGASLTYVFWGLLHGIYQVIEDLTNPLWERFLKKINAKTESISWKILRMIKTFILVDFAWIFFRAESIKDAFYVIRQSLDLKNWGLILNGGLYELGLDERNMSILILGMIILFLASVMKEKKIILIDWISRQTIIFRYILYWGALILIIFSSDITGQEFIYFQF